MNLVRKNLNKVPIKNPIMLLKLKQCEIKQVNGILTVFLTDNEAILIDIVLSFLYIITVSIFRLIKFVGKGQRMNSENKKKSKKLQQISFFNIRIWNFLIFFNIISIKKSWRQTK